MPHALLDARRVCKSAAFSSEVRTTRASLNHEETTTESERDGDGRTEEAAAGGEKTAEWCARDTRERCGREAMGVSEPKKKGERQATRSSAQRAGNQADQVARERDRGLEGLPAVKAGSMILFIFAGTWLGEVNQHHDQNTQVRHENHGTQNERSRVSRSNRLPAPRSRCL